MTDYFEEDMGFEAYGTEPEDWDMVDCEQGGLCGYWEEE